MAQIQGQIIMTNYKPVIGIEAHVELKTRSKMFCGCSTDYFGAKPNTHVCPVCLGLPGSLPVPNKKAIEWCVMIGLALNCEIPLFSKFDRKNYFYPDLPKGYQISQYDHPFAIKGSLRLNVDKEKLIRIRRVHMEEDTGKLIHQGDSTLIDFNRSGVPLVEIVTEPDFQSATEVVEYLKKLQQIVRYLEVSNADMEKGEMRLEPNISLREVKGQKFKVKNSLPNYKVEIKNINSFRFVEKAINYEIDRQKKLLELGKIPAQETRGWDERRQITVSQRIKEEAHDYRYFPEADIPPIRWNKYQIRQLADQIPELPDQKSLRFQKMYKLSTYYREILVREKSTADFFEDATRTDKQIDPKTIANWIINKKINVKHFSPLQLVKNIRGSTKNVEVDEKEVDSVISKVILDNPKAISDYKSGKKNASMFLLGVLIKKIGRKINIKEVRERLESKLNSI